MTHYDINYTGIADRKAKDAKAIQDIRDYLNPKAFEALIHEAGKAEGKGTAVAWRGIDFALGFAGIQGLPCHAFGRTYCLTAYRAWMHEGDDAVQTDEEGFELASS